MKKTKSSIIKSLNNLIAKGNLKQAIKELQLLFNDSPKLTEIILQSTRYNNLKEQIRLGTIDLSFAQITENKITFAVLELLNEIDEISDDNQEVLKEIEGHNTSTVINQNHSGSGDNIGGDKIINN